MKTAYMGCRMINIKLPENLRESIEYLQSNMVHSNKGKKKISKCKAIQLAIKVYEHFIKSKTICSLDDTQL